MRRLSIFPLSIESRPARAVARVRGLLGTVALHETTSSAGHQLLVEIEGLPPTDEGVGGNAALDRAQARELRDELDNWLTS